jgi:hypothetical protein
MAGLAPIAFNDPAARRSTTALMVLLILSIALSVFLSAVFSAPSAKALLRTLSLFEAPEGGGGDSAFDSGFKLMISFFNRTQESLGMYLLMLFGLTLTRQE